VAGCWLLEAGGGWGLGKGAPFPNKNSMMKRYNNLFPNIIEFENLYVAFRRAAKGKRSCPEVAAFELDLEPQLFRLRQELQEKLYTPAGYYSFYIFDPKHRLISAAPFRDRVVHHALYNVIESIFERTFIGDSYANRIGKGTHRALDRAQQFARRYAYVLQCDVRQFFPSIDHAILTDLLHKKIVDTDVRWLMDAIIRSGRGVLDHDYKMQYFPGDDLLAVERPRGLPIGNLTSQFWANVYLNELDQYVKRELRCPAYVRYVDDFLLYSNDKPELWRWREAVVDKLATLRLTIHERRSTVYPVKNGIPFLGFQVFPTHRRLKRRNGVMFKKRLQRYWRMVERGEMTIAELSQRIQGWVAHAAMGDTWGLRKSLLALPHSVAHQNQ
jgi:RNA-directed DNA polymerase